MVKNKTPKIVNVFLGGALLIVGITLVLAWWPQVVNLFKGVLGIVLAVGGLAVLYFLRD